jgi:hypothetical protein
MATGSWSRERCGFVPVGPHDSFAFTWVRGVSPFEAIDHHVFDVEWRSPGGKASTLERATFNLQYQRGTHRLLAPRDPVRG